MAFDDAPTEVAALERELARLGAERLELFARLSQLESERTDYTLELMTMAAHELRTPLQSLMLSTDLMLERARGTADEVGRAWLVKQLELQEGVLARLQALTESWLLTPQLRAGTLPTHHETFDLAELVRAVMERHADALAWARCAVELDLRPVVGSWDRVRVDAVVSNLVTNAIKYGAGQPLTVRVDGGDAAATISVRDHGVGVAAAEQARIFERFERAAEGPRVPGLGVGLWMSRVLLRGIGGTIAVDSALASGATFTVTLPRSPA